MEIPNLPWKKINKNNNNNNNTVVFIHCCLLQKNNSVIMGISPVTSKMHKLWIYSSTFSKITCLSLNFVCFSILSLYSASGLCVYMRFIRTVYYYYYL